MRPLQRTTVVFVFAFGMSSCTTSGGAQQDHQLASVLKDMDSGTQYAATRRCLSSHDYDTVEVLDDQHILFKDKPGNDYWLNTLRSKCAGLNRHDTLLFEKSNNQVCNLDTAEVTEHFLFWHRTGPVCTLGKFNQLTESQAALIENATGNSS